jgi:hypothetical protein
MIFTPLGSRPAALLFGPHAATRTPMAVFLPFAYRP